GNHEESVLTAIPTESIGRLGDHPSGEEGRVVVGGRAAVDEDERLGRVRGIPCEHLGRKEDRRGRAGPDDLPEWNSKVAIRTRGVVVLRPRVAQDWPGRIGRGVARDDEEQALEVARLQRRRSAEHPLELRLERAILVERLPALEQRALAEHLASEVTVERDHLRNRHAARERSRDDGAGARPCDDVEEITQPELWPSRAGPAQQVLDPLQNLQGQQPADAATVEGEHSARAALAIAFGERTP